MAQKKLNKLKLTSLNETFLVGFNVLTFCSKKPLLNIRLLEFFVLVRRE